MCWVRARALAVRRAANDPLAGHRSFHPGPFQDRQLELPDRPHNGGSTRPQLQRDLGRRVRTTAAPTTRLGPGPPGQHPFRPGGVRAPGERHRRTLPRPTAPHPLRPAQQPRIPPQADPAPAATGGRVARPPPRTTGSPPGPDGHHLHPRRVAPYPQNPPGARVRTRGRTRIMRRQAQLLLRTQSHVATRLTTRHVGEPHHQPTVEVDTVITTQVGGSLTCARCSLVDGHWTRGPRCPHRFPCAIERCVRP